MISGPGRFPGKGNDNPLQYFWPGKPHGQRSLEGLQSMGLQRFGHGLATEQKRKHSWILKNNLYFKVLILKEKAIQFICWNETKEKDLSNLSP